ncbi:MAG: insulinase family protein [Candidatus Nomurabacteria bacterium]|jgi:predicted Zn-dependent peptidase|nr:insulinase family protein [Candidatus Nomurabacteria bacterium]
MRHGVEEVRLKNGAVGLFINIPTATVMSYQFNFRAGNRYTRSHDRYETAHLMEHMAFGANSQFKDEHTYEAEFTKNGAYHNASTGDISMTYVANCADFEWQRILELQELAIAEPRFNNTELESEKGNVRNELTDMQNDYNRLIWPKVQQSLGEDTLLFSQRAKTVNDITLADIKEHYARTHTAGNMRFIVAGKLRGRRTQIKDMLENWHLAPGERFEMPRDTYERSAPTLIRRKDATNLTFGWSSILPRKLEDSENDAMGCLNHILTGTLYSKVLGKARKRGLVYGVFSDVSNGPQEASWDFGGSVNYDTASALFDLMAHEIKEVLKGNVGAEDVDAAKQYALGRYQMGAQTVGQISNFYSGKYFMEGIIDDYTRVPDMIKRVSIDGIVNMAREFFAANTWTLAAVGSCAKQDLVELNEKLVKLYPEGVSRI